MVSNNKVAFHTLGCKLNFTETSTIERSFVKNGFQITNFNNKADFYVINTCSVTENADKELTVLVKKALKKNPNAFIAAIEEDITPYTDAEEAVNQMKVIDACYEAAGLPIRGL